jgi:hypothetical protein
MHFINGIDTILNHLISNIEIIMCCDINYLADNCNKQQLDNLLGTYNLLSVVRFATKSQTEQLQQLVIIYLQTYPTLGNIPHVLS